MRMEDFYGCLELEKDIETLDVGFAKLEIGKSLFGRPIYAFEKIVNGEAPSILLVGAIHAREFVTAKLSLEIAKLAKTSVAVVPIANPDGVELVGKGLQSCPISKRKMLFEINQNKKDFSMWKANGRGVDLNVNFDADWGQGDKNVFLPSSENYVGQCPFSESETYALKTYAEKFETLLCYHTKGEVVYWGFHNETASQNLAKKLAKRTGYAQEKPYGSCGGMKDWFTLNNLGIAVTIECGSDDLLHPVGLDELEELLKKHCDDIEIANEAQNERKRKVYDESD